MTMCNGPSLRVPTSKRQDCVCGGELSETRYLDFKEGHRNGPREKEMDEGYFRSPKGQG